MSRRPGNSRPPLLKLPRGAQGGTMIDPRPKVLCVVPETPSRETTETLMRLLSDQRALIEVSMPGTESVETANRGAARVVAGTFDYLIVCESQVVPVSNPIDLVERRAPVYGMPSPRMVWGKDKVGFGYQSYSLDASTGAQMQAEMGADDTEVDVVAGGCLIVSREVLQELESPFTPIYDRAGIVTLASFAAFCNRAKNAGFKILTRRGYVCEHFQRVPIGLVIAAMIEAEKRGKAEPGLKLAGSIIDAGGDTIEKGLQAAAQ